MPMRDMASDLSGTALFDAGVLTATPTALTVDVKGFEGLTLYFPIGVGGITFTGANRLDITVTHSDDGTTFLPVAASDLVGSPAVSGSGVVISYQAAKAARSADEIGYKGSKRYVQAVVAFAGVHATGTSVAGLAVKGFPLSGPVG